jgi:glyoxylase-like metal-dependent hydrolase (beta-lactamase superfamily II)
MKPSLHSHGRRLLSAVFGVSLLLGLLSAAHAEAPLAGTQAPGYYRLMLGQFEITALYDGYISIDRKLMQNASETEIRSLLARMFITDAQTNTAVNAYLINTGSQLVLVDAGAAGLFGPTLGSMLKNLRASGYEPSQVDAVLITHLHGDHMGGLLDDSGKPVFTNATVYVAQAESDFFLSPAVAAKAPAGMQRYFRMARNVAAPYIALGKWKTFEDGKLPVQGIKAIAIPGHTPGHTAYEVSSGGRKLLIMGDLIHSMAVQFVRPDVSIGFDTDQKKAVATRREIFKSLADSTTLVAGMHLPFPGIGRIRSEGENRYAWVPIDFFQAR